MNKTVVRMRLMVTMLGGAPKGCALWNPRVLLGFAEQDGFWEGWRPAPGLASLFFVMVLLSPLAVFATETRNPFQFEIAPPPPPVVEQPTPKKETRPAKPQEPSFVWQIQGIFQSENGNMALLNYRFVSVGNVIRGWTVREITDNAVYLGKEGKTIQVTFEP